MRRLQLSLAAGWFVAMPFVLLGAPERWQWLACGMGCVVGFILSDGADVRAA